MHEFNRFAFPFCVRVFTQSELRHPHELQCTDWYGMWYVVFLLVSCSWGFEMICASFHFRVSRVCCWFPEEAAVTSLEWQLVSGCWHLLIEFGLLHDRGVINVSYYTYAKISDRIFENLIHWRTVILTYPTLVKLASLVQESETWDS